MTPNEFKTKPHRSTKKNFENNHERRIHVVVKEKPDRDIDRQIREIASKYDTPKEYLQEGYTYEGSIAS